MRTAPRVSLAALAIVLVTFFAAGCAKKAQEAPPQPPTPPPTTEPTTPATPPAPAPAETPAPKVTAGDFSDVFFDFDSATLRGDATSALDKDARLLRDNADLAVTIEGHCDERGTVEYNQALGERRANAARDYLVNAGVPVARIQTVSYGKERPFNDGHDEAAWAQNRRAHFTLR